MFDIFLILIIFVSIFLIIKILVNKFPFLVKINIDEIAKEKEKKLKFKILEKKFREKLKKLNLENLAYKIFGEKFKKIKERISLLEEKYFKKYIEIIKKKPLEADKKIKISLKQGEKFLEKKDFDQAEKKFKEVIYLDPRNLFALKNLLEIYLYRKDFLRAKEISKYILELNKQAIKWWQKFRKDEKIPSELINEITLSLINLGNLYQEIKEFNKAFNCFKKAFKFIPNNPLILDFLIENSIILKKKEEAEKYLKKIKEINPENQKISEWEKRIASLN